MFKTYLNNHYSYSNRRLTTNSTRVDGRKFAKLSHANPTIVFSSIVESVKTFKSYVGPNVDACRYLTPMGYDMLTCTIYIYILEINPYIIVFV